MKYGYFQEYLTKGRVLKNFIEKKNHTMLQNSLRRIRWIGMYTSGKKKLTECALSNI